MINQSRGTRKSSGGAFDRRNSRRGPVRKLIHAVREQRFSPGLVLCQTVETDLIIINDDIVVVAEAFKPSGFQTVAFFGG